MLLDRAGKQDTERKHEDHEEHEEIIIRKAAQRRTRSRQTADLPSLRVAVP